jgi:hypothetical protein
MSPIATRGLTLGTSIVNCHTGSYIDSVSPITTRGLTLGFNESSHCRLTFELQLRW